MNDPTGGTPQPWWAAALAAVLFTIRWLIGFGGHAAQSQVRSLSAQIKDLKADLDEREETIVSLRDQVAELTTQVALLRQQIELGGVRPAA